MNIKEFQEKMREIYFEKDYKRGINETFKLLVKEVNELGEGIFKKDVENIKSEVADVLAWLASLCNLLNIDLEEVALEKYNDKCPKCGLKPCLCKK
ncbi:MAG: MazG nucleotide pyrophosphohydrolase domain-containing protein [Nitrososphaerota archaeon]